jgi:hypothetical protein
VQPGSSIGWKSAGSWNGSTSPRTVASCLVTATDEGLRTIDEFEGAGRTRLGGLIKHLSDQELAGFLLGIRALRAAGRRAEAPAGDPIPAEAAHPTDSTAADR